MDISPSNIVIKKYLHAHRDVSRHKFMLIKLQGWKKKGMNKVGSRLAHALTCMSAFCLACEKLKKPQFVIIAKLRSYDPFPNNSVF